AEKRRSKDLPFDLRALTSASLDDLDLEIFRRVYLPSSLANDVLQENLGIELARQQLLKNGNPPLKFTVEDAHVLVTLKKKL
ncbi:MAG: hypothetical protein ACKPFI_13130, partial [Dolichospermum sp.]